MAGPPAGGGTPEAFDGPTLISYAAVERGVWDGGDQAGRTLDWVYADSPDVCQIVFSVPAGGRFLHTGDGFDVYERDIVWRVLDGTLVAANPATGEVHLVEAGESLLFTGETWLDGWNHGAGPATAVEFTAPSRSRAASVTRQPWPPRPAYARDELLGRWPVARGEAEASATVRRLRNRDLVWRLEGEGDRILVGHILSTRHLTVGEAHLLPGQRSSVLVRDATATIYILVGCLGVELTEDGSRLEAQAKDSVYLPPLIPHRLVNMTSAPVQALFQLVAGNAE